MVTSSIQRDQRERARYQTSMLNGNTQILRPIVKTIQYLIQLATNSCGAMIPKVAISPSCSEVETNIHKCAQRPCKWLKPDEASIDWCKPESKSVEGGQSCTCAPFPISLMMRVEAETRQRGVVCWVEMSWAELGAGLINPPTPLPWPFYQPLQCGGTEPERQPWFSIIPWPRLNTTQAKHKEGFFLHAI